MVLYGYLKYRIYSTTNDNKSQYITAIYKLLVVEFGSLPWSSLWKLTNGKMNNGKHRPEQKLWGGASFACGDEYKHTAARILLLLF